MGQPGFADQSQSRQDREAGTESARADHQQGSETPAQPLLTLLVGRDAELSMLTDRWEQAQEGRGQIVLMVGEPGLGKSRLVRTITRLVQEDAGYHFSLASASAQESSVVEWRCSEHFQNSEFYPASDFMTRLLGLVAGQSPGFQFERLAQHLESYSLNGCIGLMAKLLFLPPDDRYAVKGLTPAREREETFRALHQWLAAYSAKRPTLFIVEDLHWSDASTLEFLGQFIGESKLNRILTVLTFRPEFKIPWAAALNHTILALNRLTRRQVTEWMRRDWHEALPESLVAQIYERTGGIPLLVEEFTRIFRESPAFGRVISEAADDRRVTANEIPATLQGLVVARLEHMASDREIALLAATLGRQFPYQLLAAISAVDEQTLRTELAKLVSADILNVEGQPPLCTYLFRHALLEEALYTAIDQTKRRQFHRRIAETIETRFTASAETQPELLAEHCAKGGLIEKAIRYHLKAGLRSRDRFANVEAVSHFHKGLELLETMEPSADRDSRELDFLAPLGTAYIAWRGYAAPEVGPIFRRAHELCERVGQTPQLFPIMWGNFAYHIVRGDLPICSDLAEEAIAFGQKLNDPGIVMEALFLRGVTQLYRGDFSAARISCARGIAEFDDRERAAFWAKALGEDVGVTHRCYLALALWHLGFPEQALQLNRQMVDLARSINQPFSLAYALHHTGWLCQHCRLGLQTQMAGEEQMRIATEQGFLFWHASGTLYAAGGLLLQARLERALRLLQEGLDAYRGTGAELGLPYYLGMLADAFTRMGRFAEAAVALNEAFALAQKNDERFQEAELYRLKGELLLAESDDRTAAEECFHRAVETADRCRSKAWKLRATTSLARLWQKRGRREEAFKAISAVYGTFTEGFNTPDLIDAATLIESLVNERMRAEFAAGLKYVRDCIPSPIGGLVSVDWRYVPASTLGGDTIGYHWLDKDHLAFYLIDVTGHGLDSALLSVTVTNVIRTGALSGADMKRPDQVLTRLNEAFQGERHGNKYFTIWYGVYESTTRTLTWAGGGHPPSVVLLSGERDPLVLASEGMMMGVLRNVEFPAEARRMPVNARLVIFSDGVFEIFRQGRQVWNLADCIAHLAVLGGEQGNLMDKLLQHVQGLRGSAHLDDDFSVIEAHFH